MAYYDECPHCGRVHVSGKSEVLSAALKEVSGSRNSLNALAAECHDLALARGKYPDGWTIQTGIGQIIAELHEWLWEAAWSSCCDRTDRSVEEAGDALAVLLSVMVHEGIDPAAALTGALERGRGRVWSIERGSEG